MATNAVGADVVLNVLKNAGVNTTGMNAADLVSALAKIYPDDAANLSIVGFTPSLTAAPPAGSTIGPTIGPTPGATPGATTSPATGATTSPATGATTGATTGTTPPLGSTTAKPVVQNLTADNAAALLKSYGISTTGLNNAAMAEMLQYYQPQVSVNVTGSLSSTPASTASNYGPSFVGPIMSQPSSVAANTPKFVPKSFMTPGMSFNQPTQFGQQASAPLNLSQKGATYGAPAVFYANAARTTTPTPFQPVAPSMGAVPAFQNPFTTTPTAPTTPTTTTQPANTVGLDIAQNFLRTRGIDPMGMSSSQLSSELAKLNPGETFNIFGYADGGMTSSTPQFQNPFGPQQTPNGPRMNNPGPMQQPAFDPRMQPQSVSVGGTPQQPGLPSLLSNNTQNQYPNGYTPIGQPQQNPTNYGMYRS